MKHFCKNCEITFEGNYCNNCGQNAKTYEINFKNFMHDVTHLLHFEKGLFYTTTSLIINPGTTIRSYLEGKRVNHIKPLTMLILLAGIFGFMYHTLDVDIKDLSMATYSNGSNVQQESINKSISEIMQNWMTTKQSLLNLFFAIFWTFSTVIFFRKQGYNFFEHLVINTFGVSQRLAITTVCFPIAYFICKGNPSLFTGILFCIETFLTFRTYLLFYNQYSWQKRIWLTTLSWIVFWVIYILIISIASMAYIFYTRPELLKN